jgi:hypothetical protein
MGYKNLFHFFFFFSIFFRGPREALMTTDSGGDGSIDRTLIDRKPIHLKSYDHIYRKC